jgi:hypothetical protein
VTDEYPVGEPDRDALLRELETGTSHRFADWPSPAVPKIAAGAYTIWDRERLIYVGMSGRALTPEGIDAPDEPTKAKGLPQFNWIRH